MTRKRGASGLGCVQAAGPVILIAVVLLIIGGLVWYEGYCRGWWLPDNRELLVSPCEGPGLGGLSPDGRYLLFTVHAPSFQAYLLDLRTNEETPIAHGGGGIG